MPIDFEEYNRVVKYPSYKDCPIPDDYRERAAFCVKTLIGPLTELAKKNGYLLVAHGSLVRDIDLVAVPWESVCSDPICLAEDIQKKCAELVGHAMICPIEDRWFFHAGSPGGKPHGRLAWTFHLGGGPYIDLSVFPPCPRLGQP